MNNLTQSRQAAKGSELCASAPLREIHHGNRGRDKSIIKRVLTPYVAALRAAGGAALVELRKGKIFINGQRHGIGQVTAMRRELEARKAALPSPQLSTVIPQPLP